MLTEHWKLSMKCTTVISLVLILALGYFSPLMGQQKLDVRSIPTPSKSFVRTTIDPTGVTPGPSGFGVVWDFEALPPGTEQRQFFLSKSELPKSVQDSFPLTQVGIQTDSILVLYATVGRYLRLLGYVTPSTQMTVVTDPYDTRPTEIVFSGRLLDAYKAIIRVGGTGGQTARRTGQHSITYDGFGTLILPQATYRDVARLTTKGSTTDSITIGANTIVTRRVVTRTTYQEYSNDTVRLEIEEVTTTVTRNGQPIGQPTTLKSVVYFGRNTTTSVEEDAVGSPSIVPNPSNGSALVIKGCEQELRSLYVFDVSGTRVANVGWTRRGDAELSVTLPGLANGAYVVLVELANGSIRVMPFTVMR